MEKRVFDFSVVVTFLLRPPNATTLSCVPFSLWIICVLPRFTLCTVGRSVAGYQVSAVMTPLLNNEHEWSDKARTRQRADPLKSSGQNANCSAFSCADTQTPNFTDAAAYQYLIGQDVITCTQL